MLPATVQSGVYEHLDWFTTYDAVSEKVVSLVQVARGTDGRDCSYDVWCGHDARDEEWSHEENPA